MSERKTVMNYECVACLLLAKEKFFDTQKIYFNDTQKENTAVKDFYFEDIYSNALK